MRKLALLSTLSLVVVSTLYPAGSAGARKGCTAGASAGGWKNVDVLKVTAAATEQSPIVIDYRHDAAVDGDDLLFYFRVDSGKKRTGLHIRTEWDPASTANIDLLLDDEEGNRVAYAGAWNIPVLDEAWSSAIGGTQHGGLGYEYINGADVKRCNHYRLTSFVFYSALAVDVRMTVWLGPTEWKP